MAWVFGFSSGWCCSGLGCVCVGLFAVYDCLRFAAEVLVVRRLMFMLRDCGFGVGCSAEIGFGGVGC